MKKAAVIAINWQTSKYMVEFVDDVDDPIQSAFDLIDSVSDDFLDYKFDVLFTEEAGEYRARVNGVRVKEILGE
jgi:hypothetical protein